jgi:D-alanyl-lipoteichoic acid acyltransferase DltB (MBOAT superfamily)
LILLGKNRKNTDTVAENNVLQSIKEIFQMGFTFLLVVIGWVFFRAENIGQAFYLLKNIFSVSIAEMPDFDIFYIIVSLLVLIMFIFEWVGRYGKHPLEILKNKNKVFRWMVYFFILFLIFCFRGQSENFIYFQF